MSDDGTSDIDLDDLGDCLENGFIRGRFRSGIGWAHVEVTRFEINWNRFEDGEHEWNDEEKEMEYRSLLEEMTTYSNTLKTLIMVGCPFTEFPSEIEFLEELEQLIILNCNFETLPAWIGNLKKLRFLNIKDCREIQNLPTEIGNLEDLTTMYIDNNRNLETIPKEIGNQKNLRELKLFNIHPNVTVPPEIFSIKSLKYLELSCCHGIQEVSNAKSLEKLMIWFLPNCVVPPNEIIGWIPQSLKRLDIIKWPLPTLPSSICELQNLEFLSVLKPEELLCLPNNISRLGNLKTLQVVGCNKIDIIKKLGQDASKMFLPRGIRDLLVDFPHDSMSDSEIVKCIRNSLECYHELCNILIRKRRGVLYSPPVSLYEIYLRLFNQCGRCLLSGQNHEDVREVVQNSSSSHSTVPLSVWPTVLARVHHVTHNQEGDNVTGQNLNRVHLEVEASIIFSLLKGPAFLYRNDDDNNSKKCRSGNNVLKSSDDDVVDNDESSNRKRKRSEYIF